MEIKEGFYYTDEHEWAKIEGNIAIFGITDYAQHSLGDVTYVEIPSIGKEVKQFEVFSVIESVKAASDIFAPLSGKVIEVNKKLEESPELINQSPYEEGWIAKVEIKNKDEIKNLKNASDYRKFVEEIERGES